MSVSLKFFLAWFCIDYGMMAFEDTYAMLDAPRSPKRMASSFFLLVGGFISPYQMRYTMSKTIFSKNNLQACGQKVVESVEV